MQFLSPFRAPFPVTVLNLHEMVGEKIRALYQRGNPRDLYDLWFILAKRAMPLNPATVAALIPIKFRLVSGGWRKQYLYDTIARDAALQKAGRRVVTIRECEITTEAAVEARMRSAFPNR